MPKPVKESWFTRGTFLERLAKESLIIAPVSFLMCYYYAYFRSRMDIPLWEVVAMALLLTCVIGSYNASRPVVSPRTSDTENKQVID